MEQSVEDLWFALQTIDNTWQIVHSWWNETVLRNADGQEVHADSLTSAVQGALAIAEPRVTNKWN